MGEREKIRFAKKKENMVGQIILFNKKTVLIIKDSIKKKLMSLNSYTLIKIRISKIIFKI